MKTQNTRIIVGSVGFVVLLALNLLAIFVFDKASALFFSEQWWTSWFPGFAAWVAILIMGLATRPKARGEG